MNRKQYGFTPGVASLIMVLVTLAMVVFSTLYLVQANSNLKMTYRNLESNEAYYRADSLAMEEFYALNEALYGANDENAVRDIAKDYGIIDNSGIIRRAIDIDDKQYLELEFKVKNDGHYYAEIVKWQKNVDYEDDYENNNFDF